VISVTFSSNVPLGPASAGDDDAAPQVPCWLQISGLHPYAPPGDHGTRAPIEGTAAHCLSPLPDGDARGEGVWEPGGTVRVYLREILLPNVVHTVGIRVTNPPEPFAVPPLVEMEANGSVRVPRMPLRVALRAGASDEDDENEDADGEKEVAGLGVSRARFVVAKIVQSSFLPGGKNRLTVTFSTSVPLAQERGAAEAGAAAGGGGAAGAAPTSKRQVITGLKGSQTRDKCDLRIEPAEGSDLVLGCTATWLQLVSFYIYAIYM